MEPEPRGAKNGGPTAVCLLEIHRNRRSKKLNEKEKKFVDSFQRLVKPQVYNWIHDSIHEVIHMNYKDLQNGTPFPQAVTEFLDWCGEEYIFFTWGNQDVMELQRNMKYYGRLSRIKGPVTYYDVQKLFAIRYEENRRAPCPGICHR